MWKYVIVCKINWEPVFNGVLVTKTLRKSPQISGSHFPPPSEDAQTQNQLFLNLLKFLRGFVSQITQTI